MTSSEAKPLVRKLFWTMQLQMLLFLPPGGYLLTLLLDPSPEQSKTAFLYVQPPLTLLFNWLIPFLVFRSHTERALAQVPGEPPGARLSRLLQLPRRLELGALVCYIASALLLAIIQGVFIMGRPGWIILPALLSIGCFNLLVGIRLWLSFERIVRPVAVEEFRRHPQGRVQGAWLLMPRLSWYLPFAFVSLLLCTLSAFAVLLGTKAKGLATIALANPRPPGMSVEDWVQEGLSLLAKDIALPATALGLFLVGAAALTALQLGRRYQEAAKSIQQAIEELADGTPRLADWVATDEFGDLAFGLAQVLDKLQRMAVRLQSSAVQLARSAEQLSGSTSRQNETLARQAAALQETEVTAQEIKQTSLLASQKTESVLQMAEKAEGIGRAGEKAVEQSLSGLTDIRDSVGDMAARIKQLGDKARQIAGITTTVKDLADQSNMLALNAAIEAVRSGEHGKGFSVVAREIRTLADQSIQATNRVREILQDITEAIRTTVSITEQGSEKVQTSLVQVQSSGESLRALSSIVRDNTAAVRQIAAAVGQQNAGIGEIFEAVKDLSRMMDETMERMQQSDEAAGQVRSVAGEVAGVVTQYGVETSGLEPLPQSASQPPPSRTRAA